MNRQTGMRPPHVSRTVRSSELADAMLAKGQLDAAFTVYWDEMKRCRQASAYWSLLHVTVCLPDICGALESPNGEASGKRYQSWCSRYLPQQLLTAAERYEMRCIVLHQGRAGLSKTCRYSGFSFAQPGPNGQTDHGRLEGAVLVVDVDRLSHETETGMRDWIQAVEAAPAGREAINILKNLPSLVKVQSKTLGSATSVSTFLNLRTN